MNSNPTVWLPYCGAGPSPAEWLQQWNLDPLLLASIAAGAASLAVMRRHLRRENSAAGVGLILLALLLFVSPFCALSSSLFIARVVHHVLLATIVAGCVVLATGLQGRSIPGSLPLWTALQALVFWAWHAPPLYAAALSNDALFWLMQLTITGSAALWWAKLRQAPPAAAVVSLLATMVLMGVLGALITFAGRPLYAPHLLTTQAWGLTPLEDQQIAGILMWAPASTIYLLAACAILYRSLGRDPAATAAPAART